MCCLFNNNIFGSCRRSGCSSCGYGNSRLGYDNGAGYGCGCGNRVIFQTFPIDTISIVNRPITPVNPTPVVTPALTAVGTAGTYANLTVIPLTAGASTANSGLTVANNALNLPVGTYQISYGSTGNQTDTAAAPYSIQLYANGAPIAGETVTANGTSTLPTNVSRSIVYTATAPTALSIYNVSGGDASVASAYITATKLS